MKLNYSKLFEKIKRENITQQTLKKEASISGGTLDHLRKNEPVTMETIGKICEFLQCTPNDIVEIIFDENNKGKKEKAELRSQIAALQKKLEHM